MMSLLLLPWNGRDLPRAGLLLAAIAIGVVSGAGRFAEAAHSDGGRGLLRYDPIENQLVPISEEELKPGYIYSHFSPRLGRRVWSYLQPNGRFWYALGEGTTQEVWRLDLRVVRAEALERLARIAPDLAEQIEREGGPVYVRLNRRGTWELARTASFPTIYNLETGQRWEHHFGKYIPAVSSYGSRWGVIGGEYVASERLPQVIRHRARGTPQRGSDCGCF